MQKDPTLTWTQDLRDSVLIHWSNVTTRLRAKTLKSDKTGIGPQLGYHIAV